jgi:serine/threonine protein kinase
MDMQICPHCHQQHRTSAKFCPATGKLIPVEQASSVTQEAPTSLTGKLPANAFLHGRYVILRKVGQGGMAAVYQVTDTWSPGQFWAIKEMSDAALSAADRGYAVSSFQQEANLLRALNHPNLPKVVDVFAEGGKHYLVMEFVPGRTLSDMLYERGHPFSEVEVLSWSIQLCEVLAYLHNQNPKIIFRDLKPGNIMITPAGQVKLIDFGIVRFFKPGQRADTLALGTPGYAAPEAAGGQTDERSDLYSLCMTLHNLLTLRDPAQSIFNPPPVRSVNPSVSLEFERILMRGLQNPRDLRWHDARELQTELMRLSTGPAYGHAIPLQGEMISPAGLAAAAYSGGPTAPAGAHAPVGWSPTGSGTMAAPAPHASAYPAAPGAYGPQGTIRSAPPPPTSRPTTRLLIAATHLSMKQAAGLGVGLLIAIVLATWLMAPILARLPVNWNYVPIIALFGALGYSAYPRRGVAFFSHAIMSTVMVITIWAQLGSQGYAWSWLFLAAVASGAVMEIWVSFLPRVKGDLGAQGWKRELAWISIMAAIGSSLFLWIVSQGIISIHIVRIVMGAVLGGIGWFVGDLIQQYLLYRRSGVV